ncbi:MAG: DUF3325 domain-containing protein [Methylophaga sp.]|nr:DUF3325 domain-containing protein [Methylophaga sp.]
MLSTSLFSVTAIGMLALAMPRHWRQIATQPLANKWRRLLQVSGFLLLLLCFWQFSDNNQYQAGWVIGVAIIMLVASGWSLTFSLWPRLTSIVSMLAALIGWLLL